MGSVRTRADGAFGFIPEVEADSPLVMIEVQVEPPEGGEPLAREQREAPGAVETFVLTVDHEQLEQRTTSMLGSERRNARDIERQRIRAAERDAADSRIGDERGRRFRARLEASRASEDEARTRVIAALRGPREADDNTYVRDDADLQEVQDTTMRSSAEERIHGMSRATVVGLSAAQRAELVDDNGRFVAPDRAVIDRIFRIPLPGRFRRPLSWICRREPPPDPCLALLEDPQEAGVEPEPEPEPEPQPPEPLAPLSEEDIGRMAHRLVAGVLYDAGDEVGVAPRASMREIEQSVDGFAIHTGPADVPAVYDFHTIEMAFKSIWQDLFDAKAVHQGTELYRQLVQMGASPDHLFNPNGTLKIVPAVGLVGGLTYIGGSGGGQTPPVDPSQGYPPPPPMVLKVFEITAREWAELVEDNLADALYLAAQFVVEGPPSEESQPILWFWNSLPINALAAAAEDRRQRQKAREEGQMIVDYIRRKLASPDDFDNFHANLESLTNRLHEPYRFTTFAASHGRRSVNFGIMVTYRQTWTPLSYQVGELVRTTPLAPGETRRFSKKVHVEASRKEDMSTLQSAGRKRSSKDTARASSQIVEKAVSNAKLATEVEGSINFAVASASGKVNAETGSTKSSSSIKKEFREAVLQAAEDYKRERRLEVTVESSEEATYEESGEIKNPNDEITVTYLFYELQRRFRLQEKVQRVQPVIFVAQEFPAPHEIDEDWILTHDWILRRVLLDSSFESAMDMLRERIVGDEHALAEMYKIVEQHRRIVEETKERLVALGRQVETRYKALQKAIVARADAVDAEERDGVLLDVHEFLFGDIEASPEKMQIIEAMARDAYQRSAKLEKEAQAQFERETSALNEASREYSTALSAHLNRKLQIARLRVHIKQNIMHYMQAIWLAEPADQRYLRLHRTKVPRLQGKLTYSIEDVPDGIPMPPEWTKPVRISVTCELDNDLEYEPLAEVADIDRLLGFRGNYMIFPMIEDNVLTDYMTMPYQDPVTGLHEPDPLDSWTIEDFARYVCCLRKQLSESAFLAARPGLQEAYEHILANTTAEDDEVVVPTGSLYIEALPGSHPLLEDFKLLHRGVDVQKAFAEVRGAELENVRLAARIVAQEHGDPHIDKMVVIDSESDVVVTDDP